MKKRVSLLITGDVTGVGYRYWTRINAKKLNLTGYVKNLETGLVEAVFEGEEESIKKMIALCKKGPEVAWVIKMDEKWSEANGEYSDFEMRF